MVRQVGVEGDAVALLQLMALPVADERDGTPLDERGLAAAGLVHRRVVGRAGGAAGGERMARELGALAGLSARSAPRSCDRVACCPRAGAGLRARP